MNAIYLKSKALDSSGFPERFAVLLILEELKIHNDAELYAYTDPLKEVIFFEFEPPLALKIKPEPTRLSPKEFKEIWEGD